MNTYDLSNPKDTANHYTITTEEAGGFIGANCSMGVTIKR